MSAIEKISLYMAERFKKKKDCDNSCPIFRDNKQCTFQCQTKEFWEEVIENIILDEVETLKP